MKTRLSLIEDPGTQWQIDPDFEINHSKRSPPRQLLTPRVVKMLSGSYHLYLTSLSFNPTYNQSTGEIICLKSEDAQSWEPVDEFQLNIDSFAATHPEIKRISCPQLALLRNGKYRLYLEALVDENRTVIVSGITEDGIDFIPERGYRLSHKNHSFGTPCCIPLKPEGESADQWRLYYHRYSYPLETGLDAGNEIFSATSVDGLEFKQESGARLAQKDQQESYSVYAPDIIALNNGGYRMYYSAWETDPTRGRIVSATSRDGLEWEKETKVCLDIGGLKEFVKVSEPCIFIAPSGEAAMYFEGSHTPEQWQIYLATPRKVLTT